MLNPSIVLVLSHVCYHSVPLHRFFYIVPRGHLNNYVMVEADSHLKLLPSSMIDMNKVFEHVDMLSIGIG